MATVKRFAILGDPGATSRNDAIFSGERQFWRESLFQGLEINFRAKNVARPKISHRPD